MVIVSECVLSVSVLFLCLRKHVYTDEIIIPHLLALYKKRNELTAGVETIEDWATYHTSTR
jgi:hypothetical protein